MSLKKADSATSQSDATVRTYIRSKSLPLCHAAFTLCFQATKQ